MLQHTGASLVPSTSLSLAGALAALTLFAAPLTGCRGDDTSSGGSSSSSGGSTSQSGGGTNTGGNGQGGGAGGAVAGCEGPVHTIQDVTTGAVGPGTKIAVNGVVAMSHKFLVSHSKTTDSCLWGVFVSAPGLTETEANSGIIALSYGFKATIPEGGTEAFCPRLGQDPAGDKFPDNVKPGDVLDLVGTVSRFPDPPNCTAPNPANQVGMLQLNSVCQANVTGTAAVPAAHVLTSDEATKISSLTDEAFHDQWGGVLVRTENVGVTPEAGAVVGMYGNIHLTNGIEVGDKIYYRGYSNNICHDGPIFSDTAVMFDYVEGFHYLNFCDWSIQPNDKCSDFSPQSEDCTAAECVPDFLP